METTVRIDGKTIKLKATASLPYRYKAQFGTDILQIIIPLLESGIDTLRDNQDEFLRLVSAKKISAVIPEALQILARLIGNAYSLELVHLYNIVWTMAKTAYPALPPPIEWLDSFDRLPLGKILPAALGILIPSLFGTVESKNKAEAASAVTAEDIIVGATQRGLSLSDLDEMTLGQLVDYVLTYNQKADIRPDGGEETREAAQKDFDAF